MAELTLTKFDDWSKSNTEMWRLKNGLQATIFISESFKEMVLEDDTGDLTDQIYDYLQKKERYSNLNLRTSATFMMSFKLEEKEQLLEEIEKIDPSTLKEGKKY